MSDLLLSIRWPNEMGPHAALQVALDALSQNGIGIIAAVQIVDSKERLARIVLRQSNDKRRAIRILTSGTLS